MKVKIEISICIGLMLNDHMNPYIESTTVLSDKFGSTVMHAIMIPYDMIHTYIYAQELVIAKGLKERQT